MMNAPESAVDYASIPDSAFRIPHLPVQPLLLQPSLYQVGDLQVVPVHHQHVGIALDADLRQVDDFVPAACRAHLLEELELVGADRGPAGVLLDVVTVNGENRNVPEVG